MSSPIQITLRNMRFHVRVGILPHEAEFAQPLEIDLTIWASAAKPGELAVDYRDLHAAVSGIVSQQPLYYLETIAQQIVAGALAHQSVIGARATVRKPNVALAGPLDCAEVVVQDGTCA
jgi:dihydroneopterin aldolase